MFRPLLSLYWYTFPSLISHSERSFVLNTVEYVIIILGILITILCFLYGIYDCYLADEDPSDSEEPT